MAKRYRICPYTGYEGVQMYNGRQHDAEFMFTVLVFIPSPYNTSPRYQDMLTR